MSFNGNMYETDEGLELTTKGQIHTFSTSNTALNSGSDGYVLSADSTEATGLKYISNSTAGATLTTQGDVLYMNGTPALARLGQSTDNFTLATKGASANPAWQASATSVLTTASDLLYASAPNTLARLARGSDNQVLTMDGTSIVWETPAGGGGFSSGNRIAVATSGAQTGSSTSYASVTSLTTTLSSNSGVAFATYSLNGYMSSTSYNCLFRFDNGGSGSEATQIDASRDMQVTDGLAITSLTGQTLEVQYKVDGGSVTINSLNVTAGQRNGHMEILEIS